MHPSVEGICRNPASREILGYDRVNEPLPDSKLPVEICSHLTEARLLAQHDDFYVIYARLAGSQTEPWVEREFALRTQRRFPFAAFVFSNFGQSQWEFVYGKVRRDRFGAAHGLAHLPVGTIETDYDRVAKARVQIRTYGLNDEPLPTLGLAEAYERAFGLANGRWERIVAKTQADGTGLYLNDIGRYPLLARTEERRIIEQIDASGPVALVGRQRHRLVEPHKQAEFLAHRNRLVTANLRLALHIAKDFRGQHLELMVRHRKPQMRVRTAPEIRRYACRDRGLAHTHRM